MTSAASPPKVPELTRPILWSMLAGTAFGTLLFQVEQFPALTLFLVDGPLYVGGAVFLASLKLLVVPLVFVSLVCGSAALDDVTRLGRMGMTTLVLYLATTAIALVLSLSLATIMQPGAGFELAAEAVFQGATPPGLADVLISMVPTNPVAAMAEGNMLQVIVFSVLFGIAIAMTGDGAGRILGAFRELNTVILQMVVLLMRFAPAGVFCLMARVFAAEGFAAFVPLLRYFSCVTLALALHATITYPMLLRSLAGIPARRFFTNIRPVLAVAFSTASSNATIPVTLETAEHKLGVSNAVAAFTVPLGATINMDGTAIMQGVATCFIAQAYGIEIGPAGYFTVVATATLASIGTAGVPGVGLVTLAMVLEQVGLPVEGIALILGVDRLLDMARTAVNVTGDAAVTVVIARREGEFDRSRFFDE